MNTNTTSSGYITRVKGRNIIASAILGTSIGSGNDSSISIFDAKINSTISAFEGAVAPPVNLRYSNTQVTSQFLLLWTNEATDISNTSIETNTGAGWSVATHVSGSASSYTITVNGNTYVRVRTLTNQGFQSGPSNEVYIISAGSG